MPRRLNRGDSHAGAFMRHQGLEPREVLSHYQTRISAGRDVFSRFSVLGKTVAHSRVPNLCPITER